MAKGFTPDPTDNKKDLEEIDKETTDLLEKHLSPETRKKLQGKLRMLQALTNLAVGFADAAKKISEQKKHGQ